MITRINRAIERFRNNRKGAAAVEFALILPVMLVFYLGTFEGSQAIITKRKVDNAAEAVGGIVARSPQMDTTRMANVLLIAQSMIGASSASALTVTVTAVKVDAQGKATVDWSRKGKTAGLAAGTAYTLPAELRGFASTYYVFSTASYAYSPLFGLGEMFGDMTFQRTYSFRPRRGSDVPWS